MSTKLEIWNDTKADYLKKYLLFGAIDEGCAKNFAEWVIKCNHIPNEKNKKPLSVFINSQGGETCSGFAIIDMMKLSNVPVATICLGSLQSMAVLIAAAGTKGYRFVSQNTEIMAHQFYLSIDSAKFHEVEEVYKGASHVKTLFQNFFKQNSTMTSKQINSIVFGKSDIWLTAKDMVKLGLADHIICEDTIPLLKKEFPDIL